MEYIVIKRCKLLTAVIVLGLSFFIIVFFIHDPFFNAFIKSKAQDIPDYYRNELYRIIAEHPEMQEEVRKALWGFGSIKEGSKENEIYYYSLTFGVSEYIISISDYVKISYMIVGFFIMCITAILTKWYMSENNNFFISERKISIEKLLKELKEKGK